VSRGVSGRVPSRARPRPRGDALDTRHTAFIEAVTAGKSFSEASQIAGVNRHTGGRWVHNPDHPVAKALAEIRAGAVTEARGALHDLARDAVRALREVLRDDDAAPAARVAAAREVFSRIGVVEVTRQEVQIDARVLAAQAVHVLAGLGPLDADALAAIDSDDLADDEAEEGDP
jgi:transposase